MVFFIWFQICELGWLSQNLVLVFFFSPNQLLQAVDFWRFTGTSWGIWSTTSPCCLPQWPPEPKPWQMTRRRRRRPWSLAVLPATWTTGRPGPLTVPVSFWVHRYVLCRQTIASDGRAFLRGVKLGSIAGHACEQKDSLYSWMSLLKTAVLLLTHPQWDLWEVTPWVQGLWMDAWAWPSNDATGRLDRSQIASSGIFPLKWSEVDRN